MIKNFKNFYLQEVIPELKNKFGYSNIHKVPKLIKIVLNTCLSKAVTDNNIMSKVAKDMCLISGQKSYFCYAKKSIAAFNLREGVHIGCKVTLRKDRMYDFLERLVIIVLPTVKEFKGINSNSFDGCGNVSFAIKDMSVFPELFHNNEYYIKGIDITIVTSSKSDLEGRSLLNSLNIPFY